METVKKLRSVLRLAGLGGALLLAATLHAQPDPGQPEDQAVPVETAEQLSPDEMRQKSEELLVRMQEMLSRVVELQQIARKQKDVIKLNCVNDKLLQVKQLLNIAESARTNMVESIAQQDESGRYHYFSQISIADEKVTGLRDEAEACIGEELSFLGPTEVEVDAPPIPDDPTEDDPFPGEILEPPGYASPFL